MCVIRSELPLLDESNGPPEAMSFESLAERLREGPLRTLLTLNVRAVMLAAGVGDDDARRLEKLVELAQLARLSGAQLQDFILELQSLIDHLAAETGRAR